MELVLVLTLPATAALMIAAGPIIRALLQHGAFTAHDATASAWALAAFSLGLPANIMIKVLVPGFYARADTRMPVRIALIAMLSNLIMNLILIWPMQHVGLALSTALSCWVNAGLLWWSLRERGHFTIDARLRATAIKLLLATLAMAALLIVALPIVGPHMVRGLFERSIWLVTLMALAAVVYFGAAIGLGAFRPAEFKAQFTRARR